MSSYRSYCDEPISSRESSRGGSPTFGIIGMDSQPTVGRHTRSRSVERNVVDRTAAGGVSAEDVAMRLSSGGAARSSRSYSPVAAVGPVTRSRSASRMASATSSTRVSPDRSPPISVSSSPAASREVSPTRGRPVTRSQSRASSVQPEEIKAFERRKPTFAMEVSESEVSDAEVETVKAKRATATAKPSVKVTMDHVPSETDSKKRKVREGTPTAKGTEGAKKKAKTAAPSSLGLLKKWVPNPLAALTCPGGHAINPGHNKAYIYQPTCFICFATEPGTNGVNVAFSCANPKCAKKGEDVGRPFACRCCTTLYGTASGYIGLLKYRGLGYGIDYFQKKMLPRLGTGKDMKSLTTQMFEEQIETEQGEMAHDNAEIAKELLKRAHEFLNDAVYIGGLKAEMETLKQEIMEKQASLKKLAAVVQEAEKKRSDQNELDLFYVSFGMRELNPAAIEEAKHERQIGRDVKGAAFVFDKKAEELLFQKKTVSLQDSEKLVIDVDQAAEEREAKLQAKRENEEKSSKTHLITTIRSLTSSLAKVEANVGKLFRGGSMHIS